MPAPTTVDYGTDLDWANDLNPTGRMVSGIELLGQVAFHRWRTPRGACLDAPDDGLDISEYLSSGMTPAEIAAIPGDMRAELLKDDRFEDCEVVLSQITPDSFKVRARITPANGPEFDLVLSVADAAVKLLSIEGV